MGASQSDFPVEIELAECTSVNHDKLLIRLTGSRRDRTGRIDGRTVLVVDSDGRRHRFPEIGQGRKARPAGPTAWTASFALPARLEPALADRASVVIGTASLPLPELQWPPLQWPRSPGEPAVAPPPAPGASPQPVVAPPPTPGDAETIAALRAELQQRGATEAQLRAALADARAEHEANDAEQQRLEATHAELREEFGHLRMAVEEETLALTQQLDRAAEEAAELRDELKELRAVAERQHSEHARLQQREQELSAELAPLRAELATATIAREAAEAEAVGLRAELEAAAPERVEARRESGNHNGELDEAEELLAEARALTQRLQRRAAQRNSGSSTAV